MEQSKSIISIVKDFNALDELLIENEGELNETLEQWMKINESNLAEKVDNYKFYTDHLDSRVEYFKKIKEQCNDAQNVFKNMIERMKTNIRFTMESLNVDELRGETFRYALSKPTVRIKITKQDDIPAEFFKEKTELVLDMEKLQAAIDSGKVIPGVDLEESRSLRSYTNTKGKKDAKAKKQISSDAN